MNEFDMNRTSHGIYLYMIEIIMRETHQNQGSILIHETYVKLCDGENADSSRSVDRR